MSYQAQHIKPSQGSHAITPRAVLSVTLAVLLLTGLLTAAACWCFRPAKRVRLFLNQGDYAQAVEWYNTRLSRYAKNSTGQVTEAFLQTVAELSASGEDYEETVYSLKVLSGTDSARITQAVDKTWVLMATDEIKAKLAQADYSSAVSIYNSCRSANLADNTQDAMMAESIQLVLAEYSQGLLTYKEAQSCLAEFSAIQHYDLAKKAESGISAIAAQQILCLLQQQAWQEASELYAEIPVEEEMADQLTAQWICCSEDISHAWQVGELDDIEARRVLTLIAELDNPTVSSRAAELLALMEHENKSLEELEKAEKYYAAASYALAMKTAAGVFRDSSAYAKAQQIYLDSKNAILDSICEPTTSAKCQELIEMLEADIALTNDSDLVKRLEELEGKLDELMRAEEEAINKIEVEKNFWDVWNNWSGWNWFKRWF